MKGENQFIISHSWYVRQLFYGVFVCLARSTERLEFMTLFAELLFGERKVLLICAVNVSWSRQWCHSLSEMKTFLETTNFSIVIRFQREILSERRNYPMLMMTKVVRESWTTTWTSLTNWIIIHVDVGEVIQQLQGFMRNLIDGLMFTLINLELQRCILR